MPNVPTATALAGLTWFKSTYSGGPGTDCVEVARRTGGLLVRDSKDPSGPALDFRADAWAAFVADVRDGRFAG